MKNKINYSTEFGEKEVLKSEVKRLKMYIEDAIYEAKRPTCASYEYDPTPTAEERLKNIINILGRAIV